MKNVTRTVVKETAQEELRVHSTFHVPTNPNSRLPWELCLVCAKL